MTDMARGRIQKALSGFYYVNTGTEVLTCRARGKFRKTGQSPLVGDWVEVRELGGGEGFVEEILPRRNAFARPAVANIDQLVIIGSGAIPRTDPFLIDRVTAIAALKHCDVLVVLNKCDLDPAQELYDSYAASAIPVLRVSAATGEGLPELRRAMKGKLNALTGNSGVGKSTLLGALMPGQTLATGEISQKLGRGRHTTREVTLYEAHGGLVADTPGFASLDMARAAAIPKENLELAFPDIARLFGQCRFTGCSHLTEVGCAVREAVQKGEISRTRYESYAALYEEAKEQEKR